MHEPGRGSGLRRSRPAVAVATLWVVPADKAPQTPDRYDNGQLRFTGSHLDGEMHGSWVFYRRDGSIMRRGAFDRGRQVGRWQTFDRAGALVKETTFSD